VFADVDVSRTVGWFTSVYPVRLAVARGASVGTALRAVRDELRQVPARGLGYGALRYLSRRTEAQALREMAAPELAFNYLGQTGTTTTGADGGRFSFVQRDCGPTRSPRAQRSHALVVDGLVVRGAHGGELQLSWTYSANLHARDTIAARAAAYLTALRTLIAERRSLDAARYTPADFPLARLTQAELDRALPAGVVVDDLYPVTPMQRAMSRDTLHDPTHSVYLVQSYWRIHEALDLPALRAAWQAVVAHHPAFRTAILDRGDGELLQLVHPHAALPWQEHDWRGLSAAQQHAQLTALLRDDLDLGFDLARPPLMRVAVLRLADDVYQLVWSHHHAILDGWSMGVLFAQVFACYRARLAGQRTPLEPTPPFRGYLAWLQQRDRAAALRWWRDHLHGVVAATPLPGDHGARVAGAGTQLSADHSVRLSAAATARLQRYARQHQLTLSTLIQAAWALLLARHAGSDDVVFGVISSGRPAELDGVERMLGLFSTLLPARVRLPAGAPSLAWLQQLQDQQAELLQHEHVDPAELHELTAVPRGAPLFDSVLIVENFPLDAAPAAEPAAEPAAGLANGTARLLEHLRTCSGLDVRDFAATPMRLTFPLMLTVLPQAELFLHAAYQQRRFQPETIAQLLEQLRALLDGLTAAPSSRLARSGLPLPAPARDAVGEPG
jgi:non-ribosomal peptide synthase protein (TIGR01720 family)